MGILPEPCSHGFVIIGAPGNGLFKNCRVGSDPDNLASIDHPFQLPGGQQPPADVIVPDALTELLKLDERIAFHLYFSFSICSISSRSLSSLLLSPLYFPRETPYHFDYINIEQ